jgi:hypothetical protein
MRRTTIIPIIICLLFIIACSGNHDITIPQHEAVTVATAVNASLNPESEDASRLPVQKQIYIYCKMVQNAVEAYAAGNQGIYPHNVSCDTNSHGDTVIDLLPDARLMENIFTRACTEPVDGCSATPGQIGYVPSYFGGKCMGYAITGSGKYARYPMVAIYKNPTTGDIEEIIGRNNR